MHGKLRTGLLWNYSSFILIGITGLLSSVLISKVFGSESLGVYSINYALYIVLSQITTFGINIFILNEVAIERPKQEIQKIASTAYFAVILNSLLIILVILFIKYIDNILSINILLLDNINYLLIALVFYSFNKITFSILNGLSRIIRFSILQTIRPIAMLLYIIYLYFLEFDCAYLLYIFTIAELLTFIVSIAFLISSGIIISINHINFEFLKDCYSFGKKSIIFGISTELNTRVDILVLSFFVSTGNVGIYSFAAMFAEGFYGLLVVIRNVISPYLVIYLINNEKRQIISLWNQVKKWIYPAMLFIGSTIYFFVYCIVNYYLTENNFSSSLTVLIILIMFIFLVSPVVPFETIFNLGSQPKVQSRIALIGLIFNFIISLLLTPYYGIYGVAYGTGLTYLITSILVIYMVNSKFRINLLIKGIR